MGKIYEYTQNNSGGSFDFDERLTHRVYIEAEDLSEANQIADDMGIYFDGCEKGLDCSCCGDRWYEPSYSLDSRFEKWKLEGYEVSSFKDTYELAVQEIESKYEKFISHYDYQGESDHLFKTHKFKIYFRSMEDYIAYLSNEYGWLSPDARIFYKNGEVKEFYKSK